MKTRVATTGSPQLIDFFQKGLRPDCRIWLKRENENLVEKSGGEDVTEVNDFLPAARPHSSLKLRIEDRVLTSQHFDGFQEYEKSATVQTRILRPKAATAA
jgi:hypothetical protein